MRKLILFALLVAAIGFLSMRVNDRRKNMASAIKAIENLYTNHVESLDSFLKVYPIYFYDSTYETRHRLYKELAYKFKRAAGLLIYFESDLYYNKLVGPFQFEQSKREGFFGPIPNHWLFTGPFGVEQDSTIKKSAPLDLQANIDFVKDATTQFRNVIGQMNYKSHLSEIDAPGMFDALRMDMFRISTMDIGNADFVIDDAALSSIKGSMDSWIIYANELFRQLPASEKLMRDTWVSLSTGAKNYIATVDSFAGLDRPYLIRNYLIPIAQLFYDLQRSLGVSFKQKWSAIRPDAKHIYDREVFNPDYFAPNRDAFYSKARADLGELLFFDPILSDNNQRACASCHKPDKAFTDGESKATAFEREKLLARNSPTVINSGFQKKAFWDQRATSLEDQLDSVINNPDELHSSFDRVIDRINSSPEYVALFHKAFPETKNNGIQRQDVKNAIGVYERTVNGLNSRFDQYMRGDATKLSAEEIKGFNVYMGKGHCGVCHFAPLFNGAMPPFYEITDHHSLGVPVKDTMEKFMLDPDVGMFKLTGNLFFQFSFKTPTVRNSALTAPYMHNGVYKTLEQVVNFYDHAAGTKFDKDYGPVRGLPFFTILPVELKLTEEEKKNLVAFMHALTDTSAVKAPKKLPELKGKYAAINKRVIGGEY
jgi:cytochrome c peroxidase